MAKARRRIAERLLDVILHECGNGRQLHLVELGTDLEDLRPDRGAALAGVDRLGHRGYGPDLGR